MAREQKKKKRAPRRRPAPAEPTGLEPSETKADAPAAVRELCRGIEADGGAVLAPYREPLGGHWVVLAALPLDQVAPTPYQRDLSEPHVKRLADVISRARRYLDPVIALRVAPKQYQTPNGHHRTNALRALGARAITALVAPEPEVGRLILALNVEKAHALRERSREAIRLAQDLAKLPQAKETDFELEFESPALLTLGLCYEANGRFAGGAYHPMLRRCETFQDAPLDHSLAAREAWAARLMAVDAEVTEHVKALKEQGLESPYLRNFVVARINPLRFRRGATLEMEELLEKLEQAVGRFDAAKIKSGDLAQSGGAAGGDE